MGDLAFEHNEGIGKANRRPGKIKSDCVLLNFIVISSEHAGKNFNANAANPFGFKKERPRVGSEIAELPTWNVAFHYARQKAKLMIGNRCEIEVRADEGPVLAQRNGFGIIGLVPCFVDGGP
jgi:hypothetical protein